MSKDLPVALSIATSDSGCGAGIQADLLTFAARGVFGTTVFCCMTAQNPDGVSSICELETDFIEAQWKQVVDYFPVTAIKTGMLFSQKIIESVSSLLATRPEIPVVVDPVMVASSGAVLLQPEAIDSLKERLLPRATLITPNLDEAAVLLGWRPSSKEEMRSAGHELAEVFQTSVLIKGGHLEGCAISDVLILAGGRERIFDTPERHDVDTHGSGCTLAAAIAAELAKGRDLEDAVAEGHNYLQRAMASPLRVAGKRFISHGIPD